MEKCKPCPWPQPLLGHGLIDQMIAEPAGGAHRNLEEAAAILKQALKHQLSTLVPMDIDELLEKRFEKFRDIGRP